MIKLFEEFNQDKLYWEISVDEFPFQHGFGVRFSPSPIAASQYRRYYFL